MIGELSPDEVEEIISTQLIVRIGCHANGTTYIIPVSYAYEAPYAYVHSLHGKKLDMMRKNAEICFQVDAITNMANWKSVIAWGTFEEVVSANGRNHALKLLLRRRFPLVSGQRTHFGSEWPFGNPDAAEVDGVFFRIELKQKTGRFENDYFSPVCKQ